MKSIFNPRPAPALPDSVGRARWATSLLFVADGAGFGVWAALLPALQARLGIDEKQLAIAMLGMVAGAMTAMLGIGRIVARQGSAKTLRSVAPLFAVALCGPAFAPTLPAIVVVAAAFGFLKGSFDVAINAQALTVESAAGRPILARFQACWSLGGLVAALVAGAAIKLGAPVTMITVTAALAIFVAGMGSARHLLVDSRTESGVGGGVFHPALLPLGLLAFVALFTEGVFMDWGAVYAANVSGAAGWLAPLAYGAFCLAMSTGRLIGDALIIRLGAMKLVRLSGVLTVAGLVVVVGVQTWPATFLGFLISGLGLANMVPVFLNTAGRDHPGGAARGVAAVSSIGYIGFLAGPPLIGWMGSHLGLPGAFAVVALLALSIAVKGPGIVRAPAKVPALRIRRENLNVAFAAAKEASS